MSSAACTVNVVTTDGEAGRAGVTVSAMCSVSAEPASLLVCVHHLSKACETISKNGVFCVNVLQDNQAYVSDTFAGRYEVEDKFDCAEWDTLATGSPGLRHALVNFDCRISRGFQFGSHFIYIGEVEDIRVENTGNPLIYANRAYGRAIKMNPKVYGTDQADSGAERIQLGCFSTLSAFFMPRLISHYRAEGQGAQLTLQEGDQTKLIHDLVSGENDLALLYDTEELQNSGLQTELLVEVPPHVLLPVEHPLAHQAEVSLVELAPEPMIRLDNAPSNNHFDKMFEDAGLEPTTGFNSPSFEAVRGMVAHGLGYSLMITKPASGMSYDGAAVVALPIKEQVTPARIVLAYNGADKVSDTAKQFISYCKDYFVNYSAE